MITTPAIQPISGGNIPASLPADFGSAPSIQPPPAATPLVHKSDSVDISSGAPSPQLVEDAAIPSAEQAEQAKRAYIEKSSAAYRSFFYPISDVRFTIYKDSSGQYITRFTNLVDGSVTHIPEEDITSMARFSNVSSNPMFSTEI